MTALMAAAMAWLALAGLSRAEKPCAAEPIQISADKLVTNNDSRSAEFSGHVKVVQGKTTITSDRLKLVYRGGSTEKNVSAESIDAIEAVGNVRIEMDNRVAESPKAVYTTADRKLVLSGRGSRVTSGQDVIEGSQITFYRETGRVEMVGDEKNPVKAVIRSDQRGLN